MYLNSLSFGIRNIAEGKVKIEEVTAIISGTRFDGPEEAIERYSKTYWNESPEECADICRKLWPKVIQPRAIFGDGHFPYCGDDTYAYNDLDEFEKACSKMRYNVITELREGGYIN